MNKDVRNGLTVYGLLNTFYLKFKAVLDLNIMIAAIFILIEINRQKINVYAGGQGGDNSGIAEEKVDEKMALVFEILQNAGPARALYLKHGMKEKANKLKFTYSELMDMNAESLVHLATTMVADLTADLTFLIPSGVVAARLTLVTDAIEAFTEDTNKPLEKIKTKAGFTEKIDISYQENQVIIREQLKPGMRFYIKTDADMYSEFLRMTKAPKVGVRKPTGKRAIKANLKVTVIHDLTGETLQFVTLKMVGVRGSFITDENGVINLELILGAHMGKLVAVDMINQSFVFTLTETGYEVVIRMVPTGV